MSISIGNIHYVVTPYYDMSKKRQSLKARPALVIGQSDSQGDYVILPISRVNDRSKVDPYYDIPVDPIDYPYIQLKKKCYIRTHKQTVVNKAHITTLLGSLKNDYNEEYLDIIKKVEEFNDNMVRKAIC